MDGSRRVAVCRELTKVHEEVVRGSACDMAQRFAADGARGEMVVVIGGAAPRNGDLEAGVNALRLLVEAGAKARPAAGVVAGLTGTSANALYRALTDAPD